MNHMRERPPPPPPVRAPPHCHSAWTTATASSRGGDVAHLAHALSVGERVVKAEERVEVERVGEDDVADRAPAHRERVEHHGVAAARSHLHDLQVRVHRHVHARDRALHHRPVLQLHRHCLVGQTHQKPHQLHFVPFF